MPAADPGPIAGPGDSSPGGWIPGDAAVAGPAGSGPAPSARMPGALDLSDLLGILDLAREGDAAAGDPLGEDSAEVTLSDAGCRWSSAQLAGAAAEDLAPGAGLAYWVDCFQPAQMSDFALPAAAAACRRLASWAQAVELEIVAEMAARAAARDANVPVGPDGRPGQVPVEAAAEVSLALRMSQFGASCWTDLAVTLAWRLAGTAAALRAGLIDLTRARLIAEATSVLDDRGAELAENRVLPNAGTQTPAQLRAALRRAVMSVDPAAAERRREEAERRAKVNLYGDEEGTATLSGQNLPAVHAAAAMARITALARAMKSSGAGGGIDLLRAQVYIGLLLGTLPLIPPAEDAPSGPPGDYPDPPDEGPGPPDEPPGPPDEPSDPFDDHPDPPDEPADLLDERPDPPSERPGSPGDEPPSPTDEPPDPPGKPASPTGGRLPGPGGNSPPGVPDALEHPPSPGSRADPGEPDGPERPPRPAGRGPPMRARSRPGWPSPKLAPLRACRGSRQGKTARADPMLDRWQSAVAVTTATCHRRRRRVPAASASQRARAPPGTA